MSEEHQIVSRVREAKSDPDAADGFIREYMGFIKAETAKFTGRVPQEGRDDELSVAMLAFYESILAYDASRGPFLRFAALSMRSRLIDYARAENRHGASVSYDEPAEEGGTALRGLHCRRKRRRCRRRRQALRPQGDRGIFPQALRLRALPLRRGGQLPPSGADVFRLPQGHRVRQRRTPSC
jgi:RNA polymerase sigma factor